ncbi:hypothetical protein CAPTEDRAFT_205309 [Capitella teleta]|uniref:CARD domain-containing protein n=1 Tax=Capitella teleta TaxID=283909 RepID=R7TMJ7_CAPTE|nr:hypothetical protein CAPTEDRAFT_205309 [Capitella teleta]|eukprot:ELT94757.1 hypothetical protein CAPTEDRAFT_205309 [Capitella teleta]
MAGPYLSSVYASTCNLTISWDHRTHDFYLKATFKLLIIAHFLSIEDELMQNVLHKKRVRLEECLDLSTSSIRSHLMQEDILTSLVDESVMLQPLRRHKTEALIKHLLPRPARDIQYFFDILKKEYRFLYDEIEKDIANARRKIADERNARAEAEARAKAEARAEMTAANVDHTNHLEALTFDISELSLRDFTQPQMNQNTGGQESLPNYRQVESPHISLANRSHSENIDHNS